MTNEANPVVMLNEDVWHIVESGRAADVALCGQALRERRAHSRLRAVGRENVCPACLRASEAGEPRAR
jgi:hypothetical protein